MSCQLIHPRWSGLLCVLGLIFTVTKASAFSLLGPYTEWMTQENGYRYPHQAGGPMSLGEEYRWNLPVITYGFDSSFVAYFGEEGVAEVEQAMTLLNALPPASAIDPTTHPLRIQFKNDLAVSGSVCDLKSTALSLLLEQLGLAPPSSSMYVLRSRTITPVSTYYVTNYHVIERNYHPLTTETSARVNNTLFVYDVHESPLWGADAIERPADPLSFIHYAAADMAAYAGHYFTGLSQDDVGGLRYLYSAQNRNVERLPTTVERVDGSPVINEALRPGVEKIVFQRVPGIVYPAIPLNMAIEFDDTYIVDGETRTQRLRRQIQRPDIVFTAGDLGVYSPSGYPRLYRTTATTNWINHASLNGFVSTAGPGIIAPGVEIAFSNVLPVNSAQSYVNIYSNQGTTGRWGSFTAAGEPLAVFPKPTVGTTGLAALTVWQGETQKKLSWLTIIRPQTGYHLQSSTDLQNWNTITTYPATNQMLLPVEAEIISTGPGKFFRLIEE